MQTRILLVDDHPMFRWGVRQFIACLPEFEVVGESSDGLDALEKICELKPDIILLDMEMPGLNGLELLSELKQRVKHPLKIIVLSQSSSVSLCQQLHQAGINGYLLKTEGIDEISKALSTVLKGESYFSPGMGQRLWNYMQDAAPVVASMETSSADKQAYGLSLRELQVAHLVSQGLSNKQIAEQLGCSASTVKSHRANLMRKIGARSTLEVARWTANLSKQLVSSP